MFDLLGAAVDEVGSLDPAAFADGELSEALLELGRVRAALEAAEARLAAAWDRRRIWGDDGARSGAAWLARRTHGPKAEAAARLRLGRAMAELPVAAHAWAKGEIGPAHLRLLAQATNPRTVELLARDESMLVDLASTLTFAEFSQALDYWRQHADPDGVDEEYLERYERRRVSLDRTIGGTWSGSVLLDPISGDIVHHELERLEQRLFEEDWAAARERLERDPRPAELARSPGQRRADALVEMAKRSATAPAGGKAPKPLFTLLLGHDGFRHLSQLASGQVVPPSAVVPWIREAELERVLFAPDRSRVIDVSFKRSFTGALRRLIEVRDQVCFHDECDEPAARCQADHIVPWSAGGITAQENGRLACGYHNRLRLRRGPPPPLG